MKKFLNLLFLLVFFNPALGSWHQDAFNVFQKKYLSYIAPALENSYDYLKSVDRKYLAVGGLVLATLAYLYLKSQPKPAQVLAEKLIKQDKNYFSPAYKRGSVWDNELILNVKNATQAHLTSIYLSRGIKYIVTVQKLRNEDTIIISVYDPSSKITPRAEWRNNEWIIETIERR